MCIALTRLVTTWTVPAKLNIVIKPANSNSSAFDMIPQLQLAWLLIAHEVHSVKLMNGLSTYIMFFSDRKRPKLRPSFVHILVHQDICWSCRICIHHRDLRTERRSSARVSPTVEIPDVRRSCIQHQQLAIYSVADLTFRRPCSKLE